MRKDGNPHSEPRYAAAAPASVMTRRVRGKLEKNPRQSPAKASFGPSFAKLKAGSGVSCPGGSPSLYTSVESGASVAVGKHTRGSVPSLLPPDTRAQCARCSERGRGGSDPPGKENKCS